MNLKREDFIAIPLENDCWEMAKQIKVNSSLTIEKGYVTNGADIPRFLWNIFPPNRSDYFPAVVVHDYQCSEAGDNYYLHKEADRYFRENLEALGVNKLTCFLFYHSVRFVTFIKYGIFKI